MLFNENQKTNVFDTAAQTIGDAANLNAAQVKLVRLGLVVATIYVAGRYLRAVIARR